MNKLKKYLFCALAVVILLLIGGAYWYFNSYTATANYALEKIEYAVKNHDKRVFYEYVDVSTALDRAYDSTVEALPDAEAETVKLLKSPMIYAFQQAIDSYVETGSFDIFEGQNAEEGVISSIVKNMEFRGIEKVLVKDKTEAVALVRVYQSELAKEFIFEVNMQKIDDKKWQVVEIGNISEFIVLIGDTRREKIHNYIEQSKEIWRSNEDKMRDANFDFQRILSAKSLGKEGTRDELKSLMVDRIAKDWKELKEELESLDPPKEVASLHKLRLKIADLHIEYAEGYAEWLDNKKAATLRLAEEKIKQAKTLEQEIIMLERRIKN